MGEIDHCTSGRLVNERVSKRNIRDEGTSSSGTRVRNSVCEKRTEMEELLAAGRYIPASLRSGFTRWKYRPSIHVALWVQNSPRYQFPGSFQDLNQGYHFKMGFVWLRCNTSVFMDALGKKMT